jgi:hypothetical protein
VPHGYLSDEENTGQEDEDQVWWSWVINADLH